MVTYPNLPSAMRPFAHSDLLCGTVPVPKPPNYVTMDKG